MLSLHVQVLLLSMLHLIELVAVQFHLFDVSHKQQIQQYVLQSCSLECDPLSSVHGMMLLVAVMQILMMMHVVGEMLVYATTIITSLVDLAILQIRTHLNRLEYMITISRYVPSTRPARDGAGAWNTLL